MSRRAHEATLVRAMGLVGLLGAIACSTRKATESRGPRLSIVPREGATAVRAAISPESVALALGGLPPAELPRLREALAESTDAAIRRAAPELFDVSGLADDGATSDSLRQALPDLPALTAAANVLGVPWDAPDISVHVGPACAAAASRCVPLFVQAAEPEDALVRRGRARAWALANAALLRVPARARPALLRDLRQVQPLPSGTVAMVFDATRGTLDPAELGLLRDQAQRALAHLAADAPQRPWLDALAAARADWELPIALDPDQLLVIPRLSALARLRDFASEVERAGTFEWVVRPGAP